PTRFVSPTTPRAWTLTAAGPATAPLPFPVNPAALPRHANGTAASEPPVASDTPPGSEPPSMEAAAEAAPRPLPESVKAIQLYDSYLVLETPDGMLVIDQHALHERILFEQLKRRIRSGSRVVQRL